MISPPVPALTGEGAASVKASRRLAARQFARVNAGALTLAGVVLGFSVLYFLLTSLRFTEFYATNWDLGIAMQSAWTTTHGSLAFSSGAYEFVGAGCFFFIHPTYVMLPVSWVYEFAPSAGTLFALQAIVLASSAVPLYLIGKSARMPEWLLLSGLIVYLASFPILSALLFDFHWEAFIPAEFLWTYFLWNRGRYWWALVPATVGLFTLEVFPVLLVGLVVYFGYPFLASLLRRPREALQRLRGSPGAAVPLVGLLLFAGIGYFALSFFASHALPIITGTSPTIPLSSPYNWLGVYWWGLSFSDIGGRLLYWFLLFAAFGFLPLLLRQRLLILSLPWFLYSAVMSPFNAYTQFGFQYSLIAVGPISIAFIESLGILDRRNRSATDDLRLNPGTWLSLTLPFFIASLVDSLYLLQGATLGLLVGIILGAATLLAYVLFREHIKSVSTVGAAAVPPAHTRFRKKGASRAIVIGALIVLLASNLAMSPLDLSNFQGEGHGGYSFTYQSSPLYQYMPGLVEKIAPGKTIVSSDNLFPFIANHREAYSLLWYPATPPYFPFNASHLPEYALVSASQWFAVPPFLGPLLFDETYYGVVQMLYSTGSYPGSIYLFERGYRGPVDVIQVSPFPNQMTLCGYDFDIGASGAVVPTNGTACGNVIESRPASNLAGNNATIWFGPYETLLPGRYSVTVSLKGAFPLPLNAPAAVIVMDASAFGTGDWYNVYITYEQLSLTHWTNFTYRFVLLEPHPDAEWRGYIAGATIDGTFVPGFAELNSIDVDYTP